jgi:hypothetical protein
MMASTTISMEIALMRYTEKVIIWFLAFIFLILTSCAGDGQFAGQFTIDDIGKLWNSAIGKDRP